MLKRFNYLDFIFNYNQETIYYKFKNDDKFDLRRNNVEIYHFYHKIVSEKYEIIEYIHGHYLSLGQDANVMKNPLWRINENGKEYLLMYCEKDTICKLCETSYKKISDLPTLPDDLTQELIQAALYIFNQAKEHVIYYRTFEQEDPTSLNYIPTEDIHVYEKSGGVTALPMPKELEDKVKEFYKQHNHTVTNLFDYYGFLIVEGGTNCVPHIDDVERRRNGFQYLLKSGGDAVKTVWYEPKEEFKDQDQQTDTQSDTQNMQGGLPNVGQAPAI
jgi:hypothetical protein